jgi:hypothetical protein
MDVLDADKLLPAATQASKNLDLDRISPHQTSRRRSEGSNMPLCCEADVQLGENRHRGCVRTGHLDGERSFISSFGAAASIIASAAFMESSEIPHHGGHRRARSEDDL